MIAQPPLSQLPAVSTFDTDSAILQPALPPLSTREEVRLEILAYEIVRYCPELAGILEEAGMNKFREDWHIA